MNNLYNLRKAIPNDFEFIKQAKIHNIFAYAKEMSVEEKEDIISYVGRYVNKYFNDYQIIEKDGVICGVVLVIDYEDGFVIDELYLTENYRNLGIGTDIISNLTKQYDKLYLWVYKKNLRAFKLYEKLNFKIIDEREQHFIMLHNKNN